MAGFVALPLEVVGPGGPFWSLNAEQRSVLVSLYVAARSSPAELPSAAGPLLLEPGDVLLAERTLAERAGVGRQSVRSCLSKCETLGVIEYPFGATQQPTHDPTHAPTVVRLRHFCGIGAPESSTNPTTNPRTNPIPITTTTSRTPPADVSARSAVRDQPKSPHGDQQRVLIDPPPVKRPPKVPPSKPNSPLSFFLSQNFPTVEDPVAFEAMLRKAFPSVDLLPEVRKAWAWNQAKRPSERKKDLRRFIVNWCGNAGRGSNGWQQPAPATRGVIVDIDPDGRPVYATEGV